MTGADAFPSSLCDDDIDGKYIHRGKGQLDMVALGHPRDSWEGGSYDFCTYINTYIPTYIHTYI